MTMRPTDKAAIHLQTAALGYAAVCNVRDVADELTTEDHQAWVGARENLETSALVYAGARGAPDAAERAELQALRLFRDRVASLRSEFAMFPDVVETIDALIVISYPPIEPDPAAAKEPS